ncbi:MAG: nucleotide exchange factor GrpE [Canibacter sp.]
MTNEEQRPHGDEEVPHSDGSEAQASDPDPQDEPLTVDDILGEEQTEAARQADEESDSEEPEDAADDEANPYLEDLRRITAEYANYRKRTEENADIERIRAQARVMHPLLTVLDDLDRADAHGDLEEGSAFATIAQKLRTILSKQGLEAFGEKGDLFDPQHHEAIAQMPVPGTEEDTVLDVVERGYRLENVELRPAKVAVAVREDG